MKVLGAYILRKGLLMIMKTERSRTALIRDGIRAERMAGSEADLAGCRTGKSFGYLEQAHKITHLRASSLIARASESGI